MRVVVRRVMPRRNEAIDVYDRAAYSIERERLTWAVQRLILLNVAVFAAQLVVDIPLGYRISGAAQLPTPGGWIVNLLAFQPGQFLSGLVWKPLTYQFLHGGLLHLSMNMLWLFFFGPPVERILGTRQFFRFYVLCGAGAVLATLIPWVLRHREVSVTGASGAVMAVLVAFAVINPERPLFLFPLPIPINARALVLIVIVMNVFSGLGGGGTTSVATHFGGMALGLAYMKAMPVYRRWRTEQRRRSDEGQGDTDDVGKMVDNIFRFEDRKRKR